MRVARAASYLAGMTSTSTGRGGGGRAVLAFVLPLAAMAAYSAVPGPFDSLLLMLSAVVSGVLFVRGRHPRYVTILALGWSALPLGYPRVEAMVFEQRIHRSLPEFRVAADLILEGKAGPCWGTIRSSVDCDLGRLPAVPRRMIYGVFRQPSSVTFTFKGGSRRSLLFEPGFPPHSQGPCRKIDRDWFICF
jgi:hypothetical protein